MAAAALFLAAKVEEQPRKLEYVIRVANMCRNNRDTNIDVNSERYSPLILRVVDSSHSN
jgi:cyclin T